MKTFFGVVLFAFLFCGCRDQTLSSDCTDTNPTSVKLQTDSASDSLSLQEYFADSLNIGRKNKNKIEISVYHKLDSTWAQIKFFSKENNLWELRNSYGFEKDDIHGCDPIISDFNNDGLDDITYRSNVAARSANDVRRLFIYDNAKNELVSINNSEEYPNIRYNKELNCIDAFLVYGGCSTMFLKISGDTLKPFARVELFKGLTVSTYDTRGNEKIIRHDTSNHALYIRYSNFKPLTKSKEDY